MLIVLLRSITFVLLSTLVACTFSKPYDGADGEGWSVSVRPIRVVSRGTDRAMLFVHGLDGHYRDTFLNKKTQEYWFDIVAQDDVDLGYKRKLSEFDIYSIDYRGSFTSQLSVPQVVKQVGIALEASDVFKKYDHVWFVAHSLGGIMTKQVLVALDGARKDRYLRKIVGVSLVGVPSQGAPVAELFASLSEWQIVEVVVDLFGPSASIVRDLRPSEVNTFLDHTEGSWEVFVDQWRQRKFQTPRIYCAYETEPTFGGIKIVPRLYTSTKCDKTVPIDTNHVDLVKPTGGKNPSFVHQWLRTSVKETFLTWEDLDDVRYPGGELLAKFIEFLKRKNQGEFDRWTGLPAIEFDLEYEDETSKRRAESFYIGEKVYKGANFLRVLEQIDDDYEEISIATTPNRRKVTVKVQKPLSQ